MCGIAGFVQCPGVNLQVSLQQSLLTAMSHRGPDANGNFVLSGNGKSVLGKELKPASDVRLFLLHTRLRIIDLSERGWQPFSSADGQQILVFNGEIYNYLEIRQELESLGHSFRSDSDTEVLLQSLVEWGAEALSKFIGMFAFAFVDLKSRKLILARDFFGIKPLYYSIHKQGLAFASELKALLELPSTPRQINPQNLYDYLRFGLTDHNAFTLISGVQQVEAGHYLELSIDEPSSIRIVKYWNLQDYQTTDVSFERAAQHVRELFLKSVELHLRSDVPLGVAMSGGLDSSAIVMAARYLKPSMQIQTFSYVADDPRLSEAHWIDIIERTGRTVGHRVELCGNSLPAKLESMCRTQDEPFCGTTLFAQDAVFGAARRAGVKVMLDGQGADEIFGGYFSYFGAYLATQIRRGNWCQVIRLLTTVRGGRAKVDRILRCGAFLLPASVSEQLRARCFSGAIVKVINRNWFAERGIKSVYPRDHPSGDYLKDELFRGFNRTSLPMLLRYEDRNSMSHSIESRVPFLTPELVKFAFSLPGEYLIDRQGGTKALFRMAMKGIVPQEILDRRDKIGFATPQPAIMRSFGKVVRDLMHSDLLLQMPVLRMGQLEILWKEIERGHRSDLAAFLWRCLNFGAWAQVFGAKLV